MVFKLPTLQSALALVDDKGRPTTMFLRWMNVDFAGAIERQEATQAVILADLAAAQAALAAAQADIVAAQADIVAAQADIVATQAAQAAIIADLDAEVDRLTSVLAGLTAFTGLNVGGTNVKPFLDNTDGTKITAAAALGTDVVTTAKVLAGAITPSYYAFTAGAIVWTASSAEQTLQTVVVDVVRGDVRLSGLCDLFISGLSGVSAIGTLRIRRAGTELFDATRQITASQAGGDWRFMTQAVVDYFDTPGAGTHTYTFTFQPSESITGDVLDPSFIAQPLEG